MKKRIKILLIAAIGVMSFASCNDAIDIVQDGERNNEYDVYRNAEDVKRGINGIYNSLPGEEEIEFVSIFTDEVSIGIGNGGQGLIGGEYGFFMQTGNSFAASTWGGYYSIINRINRLFEISDELKQRVQENSQLTNAQKAAEIAKYRNAESELYALRAYAHFKLFAYFTPDYANPSGMSAMILDHVPSKDFDEYIGRSTVAEVSQFIFDDLDRADQAKADSGVIWDVYVTVYVNRVFTNTVRLHLHNMLGNNPDEVIALGTDILNISEFNIATHAEYTDIFPADELNPNLEVDPNVEIIFKLKRTINGGGAVAGAWYSGYVAEGGSAFYEMGRSLYNELDALDPDNQGSAFGSRNDVRYNVNLDATTVVATNYQDLSPSDFRNNDKLFIGKYQGRQGARLQKDIPVFRSADVLLAIAEAKALKGIFMSSSADPESLYSNPMESVQSILFYLRVNRRTESTVADRAANVTPLTINSQQEAYAAILAERRVELAFEGKRYLDMKRIGAKAGSPGFQRDPMDCAVNGACLLPVNDYRMTLPIPASEMNANPVIREQQNPGY
ncbi:MAG TPA: RagB/SusD family nutrient uptake outer membrane protein [Fermentimonas sp.]|nr:RagB/SusD family nutrient uptake outer membrane protein [Fermentimonas sp.]